MSVGIAIRRWTDHGTPFLLLSATVPPATEATLANQFGVQKLLVIRGSTERLNVGLEVKICGNVASRSQLVLSDVTGFTAHFSEADRGLIFVRTRRAAEELSEYLRKEGVNAGCYHAELAPDTKKVAVAAWWDGTSPVLVATTAFSVGIDYPSVREVYVVGLPYSLAALAQQMGRGGRDGGKSFTRVLVVPSELSRPQYDNTENFEQVYCIDI